MESERQQHMESESQSTEAFLADTVAKMSLYPDCLATPYDSDSEDSHYQFCAALAQAFDIDPYIVAQVANYDYVRAPFTRKDRPLPNCAQSLTLKHREMDPLDDILSFLVSHKDPDNGEPYEHTVADRLRIGATIRDISLKHRTAAAYFRFVSTRLWQREDYMANNYCHTMGILQKRLDAFSAGNGYVFAYMNKDRRPVYLNPTDMTRDF